MQLQANEVAATVGDGVECCCRLSEVASTAGAGVEC